MSRAELGSGDEAGPVGPHEHSGHFGQPGGALARHHQIEGGSAHPLLTAFPQAGSPNQQTMYMLKK